MNILSLFDGMSCGRIAAVRAGLNVSAYFASEVDPYAEKVSKANYPDIVRLGDVISWRDWHLPEIDLLIGGSPCQDLSMLSNGLGLYGPKSRLLYEYINILRYHNPKYFLLENVVPRKKEWKDAIDRLAGVEGRLINSDLFVPQNRPRIYWTNIEILPLPERPAWSEKYYQYRRTYFRENKSGVCPCLTANMGTGGHNVPLKSADLNDRLSPVECERLQGVPDNYTNHVSNAQRYKMLGNGWTVDVIAHVFSGIPQTRGGCA